MRCAVPSNLRASSAGLRALLCCLYAGQGILVSTQYRNTHSSIADSSGGGGCAIFLIISGVGLAAAAVVFGLVSAFVTLDMVETTETGVTEVFIEDVMAVEEEHVETSPEDSEPRSYPDRISGMMDRLADTRDNYEELMTEVDIDDESWRVNLALILATWKEVDREANQIVPPPEHAASHELFLMATGHYHDAATAIETNLANGNENAFADASGSLTSGGISLQLAKSMLENER